MEVKRPKKREAELREATSGEERIGCAPPLSSFGLLPASAPNWVGGARMSYEHHSEFGFERFVVIEFPSLAAARWFYDSPGYGSLLKLRMETTRSQVAFV